SNPAAPAKYGIRGIPTLILFKGGQVAAQKVGALSKSQLTAFLDSQLSPPAAAAAGPAGTRTRYALQALRRAPRARTTRVRPKLDRRGSPSPALLCLQRQTPD